MSKQLAHRRCQVQVGGITWHADQVAGDTLSRGMHIAFQVKLSVDIAKNSAQLTLFNLNQQSRDEITASLARHVVEQVISKKTITHGLDITTTTRTLVTTPITQLTIEAGYVDQGVDVLSTIYNGEAHRVHHTKNNPGWTTVLESTDGLSAFDSTVTMSHAPNTSIVKVLEDLATQMKVNLSAATKTALATHSLKSAFDTFLNGYSAAGSGKSIARRLAQSLDVEIHIRNGEMTVAHRDMTDGNAVLLSAGSGLIGSPERVIDNSIGPPKLGLRSKAAKPEASQVPPSVQARSLLNGDLMPGSLVQLKASQFSGNYKIQNVLHSGDSAQGDWFSDVDLIEV